MKKLLIVLFLFVLTGCTKTEPPRETIKIIFFGDYEVNSVDITIFKGSSLGELLHHPIKPGHTFLYWETEAHEVIDANTIFMSDTYLFGVYEENTYYVHLESNGGTTYEPIPILHTQRFPFYLYAPERVGYIFLGWFYDINDTEKLTTLTEITDDVTLYAKWLKTTFVAAFYYQDSPIYFIPYYEGDTIIPMDPFITEGFIGWYEEGADEPYDFSIMPPRNVDIYARYES